MRNKKLVTQNLIIKIYNEEIRRCERVIHIFPNVDSAVRLIGAMLIEQHEKWTSSHKYFEIDEYYQFLREQKNNEKSDHRAYSSKTKNESVA